MSELLDTAQAAAYLGDVSTRTVYRLRKDGELRSVKVRGSTRWRKSDLDRYLRERERVA